MTPLAGIDGALQHAGVWERTGTSRRPTRDHSGWRNIEAFRSDLRCTWTPAIISIEDLRVG